MPPRKRTPPALVPGYERIPGPLRRYRVLGTGEEISRRQYQQRARGYRYERTVRGKARARARRAYLSAWVDFLRSRFEGFARQSKTAILREFRRLGLFPPHHGARRRPTRAEAIRQEAFMEFIGRSEQERLPPYPKLVEALNSQVG